MKKVKFGTGGFRGIIGDDFTKDNVQKICQAICNIAKKKNLKKEICIGYDNRFGSEDFAKWCAEVFAGNNYKVELFSSATTTPVVMFASKQNKNPYGVMITASHNLYIYNGIKVFTNEGKDASKEETDEIEAEMENITNINIEENSKNIKFVDYIDSFIKYLTKNQQLKNCGQSLNIIFDAKNGSSTEELKKLCNEMGITKYSILNSTRDAFFGFKLPAPNIDNIDELKNEVLKQKADIGFALDADGDRLAVIDEQGNYIDNNYILAIIYYYFVKYEHKTGDSVKNCCTSSLLDIVSNNLGNKCHEVPVGFKWVSGKLIETNSILGGESSGGLAVDNHIWGKDSLLAIGLCIKLLSKLKKSFSEILKEVLHFANDYNKQIFDKAYKYTAEQETYIKNKVFNENNYPVDNSKIKKLVKSDYLKITFNNDDWVNIRFSGTEPVLRIFIECETKQEAEKIFLNWENYLKIN